MTQAAASAVIGDGEPIIAFTEAEWKALSQVVKNLYYARDNVELEHLFERHLLKFKKEEKVEESSNSKE